MHFTHVLTPHLTVVGEWSTHFTSYHNVQSQFWIQNQVILTEVGSFCFSLVPGNTELVPQNRKNQSFFQNHPPIRNDKSIGKYEVMRPVLTYAKSLYSFLFVTKS